MTGEMFYPFRKSMNEINYLTPNEEDYMEMIYRLCLETDFTRVSDIALNLNVKKPSVSRMIKKLVIKQLLIHKDYSTIKLTDKGKDIGLMLYNRHNIVEKFINLLGINENILTEVEKIEHTLSNQTLVNIKLLISFFEENEDVKERFEKYIQENYKT